MRKGTMAAVWVGAAVLVASAFLLLRESPICDTGISAHSGGAADVDAGNPIEVAPALSAKQDGEGADSEAVAAPASPPGVTPSGPIGPAAIEIAVDLFKKGEVEQGLQVLRHEVDVSEPGLPQEEVRMGLMCALLKYGKPQEASSVAVSLVRDAARFRRDSSPVVGFVNRGLLTNEAMRLAPYRGDPHVFAQWYWHTMWQLGERGIDRQAALRHFVDRVGAYARDLRATSTNDAAIRELEATYDFCDINEAVGRTTAEGIKGLRQRVAGFVAKYEADTNETVQTYVAYFRRYFPEIWDASIRPTDPIPASN